MVATESIEPIHGYRICVPFTPSGSVEAAILGRYRAGDGLQTAGGYELYLACRRRRIDDVEPCAVRGAFFRARLAEGQGAGSQNASCGRMNQVSGFTCFYGVLMVSLAYADYSRP